MPDSKVRLDNALVGAAGVYHVAAELSLRGLIALATIRNARGIDIVVVNPAGSWHANVQVKTSQDKVAFWPISPKYREFSGSDNYYVFVRYLAKNARFEVFLETADQVIKDQRCRLRSCRVFEEGQQGMGAVVATASRCR